PAGGRGRAGHRRGPAARGTARRRRVPGRRQRGSWLHGGAARDRRRGDLYPAARAGRVTERRGGGGGRDGGGSPQGLGTPWVVGTNRSSTVHQVSARSVHTCDRGRTVLGSPAPGRLRAPRRRGPRA